MLNSYLRQYNYKEATLSELTKSVSSLKEKQNQVYSDVKSGALSLNEALGLVDKPLKEHYVNTRDELLTISQADLDNVVYVVQELKKASPSHTVSWRKVRKICKEQNLVFSPSKNFKDLVLRQLDNISQAPEIGNKTDNHFMSEVKNTLGSSYLDKRYLQNYQRNLNKLQRNLADKTLFSNELLKAIAQPQVIKETKLLDQKINTTSNELIVVTSDWHIGATVELNNNQYNLKIAQQRLDNYIGKIVNIIKQVKPQKVYVVNCGDLIENVQMRAVNQSYYTDMSLSEQIVKATEMQNSMLASLATTFPNIKFVFTELSGNHDRFAPNKKNQLYGDSVARVARALTGSLNNKSLNNLKVVEPDTEYRTILNVKGHNIAFVHGDLDKLNDNNALAKVASFEGKPLDALIGGHLHSLMIKENNGYTIQSGSLIGPTEYSDRLGCYASASQVMLKVDKTGLTPSVVNL